MPLYLHAVNRILRDLRLEQQRNGSAFQYAAFKSIIENEPLTMGQQGPLNQRLETLQSFMVKEEVRSSYAPSRAANTAPGNTGNSWTPQPGQLTYHLSQLQVGISPPKRFSFCRGQCLKQCSMGAAGDERGGFILQGGGGLVIQAITFIAALRNMLLRDHELRPIAGDMHDLQNSVVDTQLLYTAV